MEEKVDAILAICSGIENLVIGTRPYAFMKLEFFRNPQAGKALRRLCINYRQCGAYEYLKSDSDSFHPCFRNLTHLNLLDDYEELFYYIGWETLTCLTHIALAHGDTRSLQAVMH